MSEQRKYRTLSDWYDDIAAMWLAFAHDCRFQAKTNIGQSANLWIELARQCSLHASRYARLAEKAKPQSDLTNVTPIKTKNP